MVETVKGLVIGTVLLTNVTGAIDVERCPMFLDKPPQGDLLAM